MTAKSDFDLQDFLPYLLNQAAEASSLEFQQLYKDRYGMLLWVKPKDYAKAARALNAR